MNAHTRNDSVFTLSLLSEISRSPISWQGTPLRQQPSTVVQLGEYAEGLIGSPARTLTFRQPRLLLQQREDAPDECDDIFIYRALLTVTNVEHPDTAIVIGRADLLELHLDDEGGAAESLAGLRTVDEDISDIWAEPHSYLCLFTEDGPLSPTRAENLSAAMIVRDVFIDPAFRGHHLGPWLLAQLDTRSATDQPMIVVGWPRSWHDGTVEGTERCRSYWQTHLNLTYSGDGIYSQMLGSPQLREAISALESIAAQPLHVDSAQLADRALAEDPTLWIETLMPEVEREPLVPIEAVEHMAAIADVMAAAEEFGVAAGLVPTVFFEDADQASVFGLASEFLADNTSFRVAATTVSYNDATGMFRLALTLGQD